MTVPPAALGQPRDGDFAARFFRALYQEFDLHTINGIYIVVPKVCWAKPRRHRPPDQRLPCSSRFPGRRRLVAKRCGFVERIAERQSLTVPSEDPDYRDLGQAFPPWPAPARQAILQPPKPEIESSEQILSAP